jgi:hypothetical protein
MRALISSTRCVLPAQSKRVSELEDPGNQTAGLVAKFVVHDGSSVLEAGENRCDRPDVGWKSVEPAVYRMIGSCCQQDTIFTAEPTFLASFKNDGVQPIIPQ